MAWIDLEKFSIAIKELELRLRAVRLGKNQAEKELNVLLSVETSLLENISILKTKEVITIAQEYRKAISDLAKCRRQLAFVRIDRDTYSKAVNGQETLMAELQSRYLKGLIAQENNVIKVDFGSKKNG